MNQKVLDIAVAAFLHDIGKFVQRISQDSGAQLPEEFPKEQFQPKSKTGVGLAYKHASYTALFIKNQLKNLPEIADMETFINLAAKHHMPSNSKEEYVISVADKLSAGMDRKNFDAENAVEINYSQYRKTRLISIFDELRGEIADYEQRRFQYDVAEFSGQGIFPVGKSDVSADYTTLAEGFARDLAQISANTLEDWFLQFDNLTKKWCSFVPSATVEKVIPDISLYDHLKTTSALAQALYVYHTETEEKLVKEHIKENSAEKKFLYFKAKFNGIQNFIFSVGSQTNKNAAKLLRGRSFYISLMMKKYTEGLCKSLGLAHTAVIMSAAGSITAILPNTPQTKNNLRAFHKAVTNWLIKQFYGELSISFAYEETAGEVFVSGMNVLGAKLAESLEREKFNKLPLETLGVIKNYFNPGDSPCAFCGKRPAQKGADKCSVCEDLIEISKMLALPGQKRKPYMLKSKIFDVFDKVYVRDYDNLYVPHKDTGETKSFEELAGTGKQMSALGVLKADIDNLGALFQKVSGGADGAEQPVFSQGISRQVAFSRMLDAFWTLWLPEELRENPKYSNIYTVFAGGDDLFLIGKWDTIIDFALHLRNQFEKYTCYNPGITLSAGIAILKPGEVINKFYDLSEKALEASKEYKDGKGNVKNALTLFGETISWTRQDELHTCYEDIAELIKNEKINSGGLSKLMNFIDMASFADKAEQKLAEKGSLSYKDMQNFKWRALLTYFIAHNENVKNDTDKQARIENFVKQIEDAGKRSILKTMLWKNIYENRRRD